MKMNVLPSLSLVALLHPDNQSSTGGKVLMKRVTFVLQFGRSRLVGLGNLPGIVVRSSGWAATIKREASLARTICLNAIDGHLKSACATWLLSLVLLLGLPTVVQAQFTYAFNNGTITITGCGGCGGAVVIPSTISGYLVTGMGDYAFEDRTNLTSVTIPDNVTNIGFQAFFNCTSLTSVTIPSSVTSMGDNVFGDCSSLTSVIIPNNFTSIGTWMFDSCYSLTSIIIPSSVTNIGWQAFYNCDSLTNLVIPNGVTSIENGAFSGCASLTSVTIPNSVISIGADAFFECTGLASVTIPNSVSSIPGDAFYGTSLGSVTIPGSVTNIGYSAFFNCTSLTNITIPGSVTNIGYQAFTSCYALRGVYFQGNAPTVSAAGVFVGDTNASVYYLAGTTGWGPTLGGLPTVPWNTPPSSSPNPPARPSTKATPPPSL